MKRKEIFIGLAIFIVGSLFVGLLIFPNAFQSVKYNIEKVLSPNNSLEETFIKEDSIVSNCINTFNECIDIAEAKEGVPIKTLKVKQVNDTESATDFWNTWRNDANQYDYNTHLEFYNIEEIYPMVMIALTKDYPSPLPDSPKTAICNSKGELIGFSRNDIGC